MTSYNNATKSRTTLHVISQRDLLGEGSYHNNLARKIKSFDLGLMISELVSRFLVVNSSHLHDQRNVDV